MKIIYMGVRLVKICYEEDYDDWFMENESIGIEGWENKK